MHLPYTMPLQPQPQPQLGTPEHVLFKAEGAPFEQGLVPLRTNGTVPYTLPGGGPTALSQVTGGFHRAAAVSSDGEKRCKSSSRSKRVSVRRYRDLGD